MKTIRTLLAAALALLAPALHAQDALITPTGITSSTSGSDFSPAANLIDGAGMSSPTLANLGTHTGVNWVTTGAYPADYFAGFPQPVLTCTLPSLQSVSELVIWGYGGNPNEAKSFTVTFSTDGVSYGNAATVTQGTLLGTGAARLAFPGGARLATHVKVTVTDNYYVAPGASGGDRVGLGELRFAGQPYPRLIVDNLPEAGGGNDPLNAAGVAAAHAFTTGPAMRLAEISVRLNHQTGGSGQARVKIWSGSGSAPALLLEDLGTVNVSGANANYAIASTTRPLLAAATRYWVTVHRVSGNLNWRTTTSATVTGNGSMPTAQAVSSNDGAAWSPVGFSDRHQFSVTGSFVVVTTTADSGPGSLRWAVANAAASPGADTITFAAPLVAGSIVGLSTDLALTEVTLNTAIAGGSVDVAVNAGTLSFQGGSVWTGGGKILLGDTNGTADATVEIAGPDDFTLAAPITVRADSSGTKTLRAANGANTTNTFSGAITLLAPATVERVNGPGVEEYVDFTGTMELGEHLLTVNAHDNVFFSGSVGRSGSIGTARLEKNGLGILFLQGGTDNPRLTATVNGGFLNLVKVSSPIVHALGSGLTAADGPALTVVSGPVNVIGGGGDQIDNNASVEVNGTLNLDASETLYALTGSGTVFAPPNGNYTLTLGSASGSHSFDGSLDEPPGNVLFNLSLTKTGAGTQTVAGGSIGGTVLVSGGTLNITGSLPSVTSTTVASGATLAGSGTVNNLTLESGSFFAPGNATVPNAIGTLTVGLGTTATWNGGATARFHLSNSGNSSDKLAVPSGALTKAGSGSHTFDFQGTGAPGFIYTLATFGSSSGFAVGNFTATNLGSNVQGGFFTLNPTSLTYTTYSTVVSSAADSGPGTLRNALATVPTGRTLTFTTSGPITLSSELTVSSAVTLDATSLPSGLTISGNNTNRLFFVASTGNLTLRSLTLTGGNGTGASFSGSGGAIFNDNGTLTLMHCTLSGNNATNGGAISNRIGGTLTLTQSTLSGNTATYGGAISNNGTLTLTHCTLSGNTAIGVGGVGGAISNYGTLTLTHCTLSGNTAGSLGGLGGGAIYNASGTLTLNNSIVAGNTSTGGGIGADILNENTVSLAGANLVQSIGGNGIVDGTGTISTADPRLAPLGNHGGPTQTMPPLFADSPALDAASNVAGLTTDQRGAPLPNTGRDIGAVELGKTIVNTPADENNGIGNGSSVSLREALTDPAPFGSELITFAPALNGATLSLSINASGSAITVTKPYSSVDASSLPAGLTIDDGTATTYRLFRVNSGSTLAFHGLTLANGGGAGFSGNGGGILNQGTLTLTQSTLSGNTASSGGAIYNGGTATLTHCTLASNTGAGVGGAISNSGPLTLTHCTLSGNTAQAGGGIENFGPLALTNTLIAGNTATLGDTNGPDIRNLGTITRVGVNLVQDLDHFTSDGGGTESGTGSILAGPVPLAGLAYYGGSTPTMPPLPGSPAIDPTGGATTSPFPTDQRGLPRVLDGNAFPGAIVDIGAVEYDRTVVLTLANTGPGSLRDTFTAAPAASTLTFAPLLSGGTITLTSEIVLNKNVTIDASTLPGGLTVSGGGTSRIFTVNSGQTVTLKNLTLTGGNGSGATSNTNGGAIYNNGTLTLERCALSGNNAPGSGGAIFNDNSMSLTLTDCTLHANSSTANSGGAIFNLGALTSARSTFSSNTAPAGSGGAIHNALNSSTATFTQCTLAGNSCAAGGNAGGAIRNNGTLALTHCTLSGNSLPSGPFGGGIYSEPGRTITLANCILHGNPAGDIYNNGTITGQGVNIVGSLTNNTGGGNGTTSGTILTSNPLLAPLANYGGPTQTMALLPGSPARNAATALNPPVLTDSRVYPIVGLPDIGAYEAGTTNTFALWALENVGTGPVTFGADQENDGNRNGLEYATRTNPLAANGSPFGLPALIVGPAYRFTFPYRPGATDLRYIVQRSPDLATWTDIYRLNTSTGVIDELLSVTGDENATTQIITLTDPAAGPRLFWRLRTEPVP